MEYKKFQWTNRTHLNADNFNNIEDGISNCAKEINELKILLEDFKNIKLQCEDLNKRFDELKEKYDKEIKSLKTKITKLSKAEKE